jgi:hypothetical protein
MFPLLPKEGQEEVALHMTNLTEDDDYGPMAKLAADAKLPEEVLDVLIQDVLNRPNALKMPTLLEIAKQPDHPKAEEAHDLLELFLEEDYGQDWDKWQSKLAEWMQQNPD